MNNKCSFCGNTTFVEKRVEYIYRHSGKLLMVNDVPCQECGYCGERYYDGPVLERIEREFMRIHKEGKKPTAQITMPLENFDEVPV